MRVRNGTGKITVNGRPFATYFPILTHQVIAKEPLRLTQTEEVYDVDATLDGGGVSGQAGAIRLGIARALDRARPRHPARAQEGRAARARRSREGASQVRPQEGPQGAAVLQAVDAGTPRAAVRHRRCARRRGHRPHIRRSSSRSVAAAARVLGADAFLVGRDTRESGPRIEADLDARARGGGRAVVVARRRAHARGRVPRAARRRCPAAIVSASHNPWTDNGVKLVGPDGRKLADDVESRDRGRAPTARASPTGVTTSPRRQPRRRDASRAIDSTRTSRTCSARSKGGRSTGCTSWSTARTAPRRSSAPRALRAAGARVDVMQRGSPTVATSTTRCGSTYPAGVAGGGARARRRPRARARRRRRPRARGRRDAASSSTATRSW